MPCFLPEGLHRRRSKGLNKIQVIWNLKPIPEKSRIYNEYPGTFIKHWHSSGQFEAQQPAALHSCTTQPACIDCDLPAPRDAPLKQSSESYFRAISRAPLKVLSCEDPDLRRNCNGHLTTCWYRLPTAIANLPTCGFSEIWGQCVSINRWLPPPNTFKNCG